METIAKKKSKDEFILEAKNFFNLYKKEIGESIRTGGNIVRIDFNKISQYSHILAESIFELPEENIALMEMALEELGLVKNPRIRFENLPETSFIKIRNIRAKHLDQILWIEGIVKQATDVRPQVVNAKFECPNCGAILSVLQIDRKFREPSRCSCGWKGNFKVLSKEMVDVQKLTIEEAPDSLEGGEQPRRISVFLKEDLVDPKMEERTTPGSKVKIYGILKEVPIPLPTGIQTRFDIAIEANNTTPMEETFEDFNISEEDEKQIMELAADPHLFRRLSQSIAPSIYGFEKIKESVLLQLFGGIKKKKSDGGMTRGDIHVLLVGDPGVAKSVMLKFVSTIAPKGRYVSGKAATAAGLTATVVKDEFLRGWALEAGAMVLSNKGTVCIDEIEKMDEHDRSTMHEAMEQQCYSRDLEILFADSSRKKIGEFVDNLIESNPQKVQQGINCEIFPLESNIKILTTDFESVYPTAIQNVSRHIAPNNMIKITLHNGREIIVTPEHPCWTFKNGTMSTTPAQELTEEDFFPIPAELPVQGEEQIIDISHKNGPALCKILGYHISDGCYEMNRGIKNGIQFWNNDRTLIEDYKEAIEEYFRLKPGITQRGNQFAVRVISKDVAEFMKSLDKNLMEKGIVKVIPDKIMKCRKEDLAFLVGALFDGDGTVVNIKRNGCRISLITENRKLAEQVSEIILRFGIISSIYKDRDFFKLDISGCENIEKFSNKIGLLSKKKQDRIINYLSKHKTYRSITDIIPNSSEQIGKILKSLRINVEKDWGNQICLGVHKHRKTLQEMIELAEKKLEKVLATQEAIKNADGMKLREIRKLLNISALHLSKELGLTSYSLQKCEERNEGLEECKKAISKEIENMISAIPKLRILKKLSFGKVKWSKIKSIEKIENPDKWVYDITIPSTHSFISNNMILHNSVTISKANIQATLRAETTVLAAGNPKLGRFDIYTPIPQQIDISPALLSRFDVIFVIRDLPNKSQDEAIATHVLEEHQQEVVRDIIDPIFLRKYIAYSKQKIKPRLSDEAVDEIKDFYVKLRNQSTKVSETSAIKPIAITPRQLEGIIRLSEAHAKMRLSHTVERDDARKAIELLKYSLQQVGYDEETQTFDIDKATTGITSSHRGRILLVREVISKLESRLGKLIPLEELEKEIKDKITPVELEEILTQLSKAGDIFRPRKGFIQRV